ncbi:MAG: hypothetical protein LQ337_000783 [Flavoplaca oasis]|nr:MAG: hypothetical protein LQ337_000783 [Flavoplaca oasis]
MTSEESTKTVKTRFCIISDTHTAELWPPDDETHAYRRPLPSTDVLLHAGDITTYGYINEYEPMVELLSEADAELKIVIAGNHDVTLDVPYYEKIGRRKFHRNIGEDLNVVKELWTGEKAKKAGIAYLEEGVRTFTLRNGARFTVRVYIRTATLLLLGQFGTFGSYISCSQLFSTGIVNKYHADVGQVYATPYQPEFCNFAFPYRRDEDRFNEHAQNPIPDYPKIDILLTHGPPAGIMDRTSRGDGVGCEHLLRAVRRCRPRLHCFGHIHEGWGAQRNNWIQGSSASLPVDQQQMLRDRCAYVNVSQGVEDGLPEGSNKPLVFGEETLFINAAIMDVNYKPVNAPWLVELDLPLAEQVEG